MLLKILVIFIIFGILGAIFEAIVFHPSSLCGDTIIQKELGLCLPFLFIYAFSGIIIYLLYNYLKGKMNLLWVALIITVILTTFECMSGLMSYRLNGTQTWHYNNGICKGYISPAVSVGWFVAISLIIVFFYMFNI